MSITLEQFRSASVHGQGKLTLSNDNQVQTKGRGLGRIVEWFRGKSINGRNAKTLENTSAKEKFLNAIRQEYGNAMADRAGHELGKHTSLKSRTVQQLLKHAEKHRADFIKLDNAASTVPIRKEIQRMVNENGGIRSMYEATSNGSVASQFKTRFGISLPPFDDKLTAQSQKELLDKQVKTALKNGERGFMGKQQFNVSELKQAIADSTLRILWKNGGLSESLIKEFFSSNEQTLALQATKLFNHALETISLMPESRESVTNCLTTLFQEARSRGLDQLAEAMVTNGVAYGMISPETPGVAEVYEKMAAAQKDGGNQVKYLGLAEKCFELAGDSTAAARTREKITTAIQNHVAQGIGKDPNTVTPPSFEKDREKLSQLREGLVGTPAETSGKLGTFIANIYKECLETFEVDENAQSMVMFGSGSRNEMFPFSDLEFAVLTKSENGNDKLHKAITLFEMRITALGETPLGPEQTIPIREGMCFDPGGNCPKSGNLSFVGTPQKVLEKLSGDLVVVEVFSAAKVMVGDPVQCERYNEGVASYFGARDEYNPLITRGQDYCLRNMTDQVSKMRGEKNPITLSDRSGLKEINAKQLSRFPFFLASSLCKFHGISPQITNTVDRLKALQDIGVLTRKEVKALEDAFNGFGKFRLLAEVHYKGQKHEIKKTDHRHIPGITEDSWQKIQDLLEPLGPIFAKVERFTQDPRSEFKKSR